MVTMLFIYSNVFLSRSDRNHYTHQISTALLLRLPLHYSNLILSIYSIVAGDLEGAFGSAIPAAATFSFSTGMSV